MNSLSIWGRVSLKNFAQKRTLKVRKLDHVTFAFGSPRIAPSPMPTSRSPGLAMDRLGEHLTNHSYILFDLARSCSIRFKRSSCAGQAVSKATHIRQAVANIHKKWGPVRYTLKIRPPHRLGGADEPAAP